MRDPTETNGEKSGKVGKKRQSDLDSDEEDDARDDVLAKTEDAESKEADADLSPEDLRRQGELADGVQKIRVCVPCPIMYTDMSNDASADY